jgi:ribonuclease HI
MTCLKPQEGIATDCAHSTKTGLTCYRGIDLKTGKQVFIEHIGQQTVNIGEFLGVIDAVKYVIENSYSPKIIYTDSITAITWFNNKKSASKRKYPAMKKAEVFLKAISCEVDKIQVLHWDNELLGEIPADFGNKHKKTNT